MHHAEFPPSPRPLRAGLLAAGAGSLWLGIAAGWLAAGRPGDSQAGLTAPATVSAPIAPDTAPAGSPGG